MFFLPQGITFLILIFPFVVHAPILLQGDGTPGSTTFSSNILPHCLDQDAFKSFFYVGRSSTTITPGINDLDASYALSAIPEGLTTAYPYAPKTVRLNGVPDQLNPLFGKQISLIGLYNRTPIAVTTDLPSSLYWVVSRLGTVVTDVVTVDNILDAQAQITSGITALTGANVGCDTGIIRIVGNSIFAIVAPHGGAFGGAGSGVAFLGQGGIQLMQFPAVTGSATVQSTPLDGTQSFVKIGNNATISAIPVDIYFDSILQRFYIVYEVTSAGVVGSGCRGIVMGYVNQTATPGPGPESTTLTNTLTLTDIAPAAAFTGSGITAIGGSVSTGAPVTTTISKFRSMYTSMGFTYGIILGSNNGAFAANRSVFAFPLVNKSVDPSNKTWPLDPTHGTLASKNINPGTNAQIFFDTSYICNPYKGRGFQIPATTLADLTLENDIAAKVGGGDTPGIVQDITVNKDTVYIACSAGTTQSAGVFVSQALFENNGCIKAWTPWQRVTCPINSGSTIYGIGYQPSVGKLFTMEGATANTIDIVATTTWNSHENDGFLGGTATNASVGFIELISNQFSLKNSGIQAAFDFPRNTYGFAGAPNGLSAMVFTGYRQIVFAQTGSDTGGGVFTPARGDFSTNMEISTNGAVTTPGGGALLISISGGILNKLDAITSAIIINDSIANAYLVVGGVGGVAVLRPGWPNTGLRKNFSNMPDSSFQMIGSYKNVRKLLTDGLGNLYVLTNTTLDRIPAIQLSGVVTPTIIATPQSIGLAEWGQFSDAVISRKVSLIATNSGLYRNGNGTDISTGIGPFNWQNISLGESPGAVTRLQPFSTTGLAEDFSCSPTGGTVYVLAASVSHSISSLYRIAVKDTQGGTAIDNTTVNVLQEYFVARNTSAFAALGTYRNFVWADGSLFTDSCSQVNDAIPATFEAFPPYIRTATIFYPKQIVPIQANIPFAVSLGGLVKESGLGSLILPTNDGMRVLG